jgi:diaminopimelate epimerase
VQTKAGIVEPELGQNGWVRVNMGYPKFLPQEIPFIADAPEALYDIALADNEQLTIDVVNMGNPHAVTIVPDVITADVARLGPQVESHERFPQRVNAGFMQIIDEKHARLRVFERGVGETLACGTGACAAAISGMRRGLLDSSVEIELAGGKLHIEWREGDVVWMTGPTSNVYPLFVGSAGFSPLLPSSTVKLETSLPSLVSNVISNVCLVTTIFLKVAFFPPKVIFIEAFALVTVVFNVV